MMGKPFAVMEVGTEYAEKFLAIKCWPDIIYYIGARTWTDYLDITNSNVLVGSRIHDVMVRVRNT